MSTNLFQQARFGTCPFAETYAKKLFRIIRENTINEVNFLVAFANQIDGRPDHFAGRTRQR